MEDPVPNLEKLVLGVLGALVTGLMAFVVLTWPKTADCAPDDLCRLSMCTAEQICPGACSCVRAPGQPWGRCRPW